MEKLTGKLWLLSSCLLAASTSFAVDVPEMLKDINQVPFAGSARFVGPFSVQSHLGKVFMVVNDGQHGSEPWVYDPQTGKAELLVESAVGNRSLYDTGWSDANPLKMHAASRYVLFYSSTLPDSYSTADRFNWISDGTKAGTWLLDEVIGPWKITSVRVMANDHMFFATDAGQYWETDGSRAGTKRIDKQTWDELADSIWFKDAYYFTRYEPAQGTVLLRKEPDVASARVMGTLAAPGNTHISVQAKVATSDAVYFSVQDTNSGNTTLWRSNGTAEGTIALLTPEPDAERFNQFSEDFVVVGKHLYFPWQTKAAGTELWVSDGTAGGTRMVADYAAGTASGLSGFDLGEDVAVVGQELIMDLKDASGLSHLVRIGAGGGSVTDLGLSNAGIGVVEQASSQGKVFAYSWSDATGGSLWVVPAGGNAVKLRDFARNEQVQDSWMAGSRLYLEVDTGPNTQILSTDGGDAGFTTITLDSEWAIPEELPAVGDKLFLAPDQYGSESRWGKLWQVDGAAGTLAPVASFAMTGNGDSTPEYFIKHGDKTYFLADDGVHGEELWVTDGTAPGTRLVADINPGTGTAFASPDNGYDGLSSAVLNNTLYFVANDGVHGLELWKTDGTEGGTVMVKDVWQGPDSGLDVQSAMTAFKGRLYFPAYTPEAGRELWSSDGTPEGTSLFKDLSPGLCRDRPCSSSPTLESGQIYSGEYQGALYFSAVTPATGRELWRTDGTAEGTALFADINPGTVESIPARFKVLGGKLYMRTRNLYYTEQALWVTSGTPESMQRLYQASDLSGMESLGFIRELNGSVVFAAPNANLGYELWKTGGTPETTQILKDVMPGAGSGFDYDMAIVGNRLYFAGRDTEHGRELWVSDGSAEGTRLLGETVPGVGNGLLDANIGGIVNHKGTAYFLAYDAEHGTEFWRVKKDGSGIERTTDQFVPDDLTMSFPVSMGDNLLFAASANDSGMELWQLRDVNSAPTIASIAAQTINAGSVATVSLNLADVESAAADLQVTASSSNAELVPASALVVSGSGASRSLGITPAAGKTGSATITVSVSDGKAQSSTQFTLTVNAAPAPTPTPSSGGGGGGSLAWLLLALAPLACKARRASIH